MTVVRLLSYNRFVKFCLFERGIEYDELADLDVGFLFELMSAWYNSPETVWGPRGSVRIEVENALKEGQVKK